MNPSTGGLIHELLSFCLEE